MSRQIVSGPGFPVIAGFGLLLVAGAANADTEASQRSYDGTSKPSPVGSSSPSSYSASGNASRLLTASGVPNDSGQLRWPLGLAILAAPGVDDLCEQIDALFGEMVMQAAGGSVSPALAEEAHQAVMKLRRLLLKEKAERFGMPWAVYQESERFLDKLDRAQRLLQKGMATPGRQR